MEDFTNLHHEGKNVIGAALLSFVSAINTVVIQIIFKYLILYAIRPLGQKKKIVVLPSGGISEYLG